MPEEPSEAAQQHAAHLRAAEFAALRHAISVRGTARMVLAPVVCAAWAALALALVVYSGIPAAVLIPLGVLAAGFEAVHALHVGAERIGRYLQVNYEEVGGPQWETVAMTVGPALPGGGLDPLFTAVFVGIAVLNLLVGVLPAPVWQEMVFLVACHALFVFRVIRARVAAARQRAVELESFRALLLRQRDRY